VSLIGEKIADSIPDSVFEYVNEHPRMVYLVTVPVLAYAVYTLLQATDLQVKAEMFVAGRIAEAQMLASEALGG
jgi:hypothetical protein